MQGPAAVEAGVRGPWPEPPADPKPLPAAEQRLVLAVDSDVEESVEAQLRARMDALMTGAGAAAPAAPAGHAALPTQPTSHGAPGSA